MHTDVRFLTWPFPPLRSQLSPCGDVLKFKGFQWCFTESQWASSGHRPSSMGSTHIADHKCLGVWSCSTGQPNSGVSRSKRSPCNPSLYGTEENSAPPKSMPNYMKTEIVPLLCQIKIVLARVLEFLLCQLTLDIICMCHCSGISPKVLQWKISWKIFSLWY